VTTKARARVLVVDNDVRVGRDIQAMMEPVGYQVQAVPGEGHELVTHAVDLARSFRPHVAIVDLRLLSEYRDERSGLGLLGRLRPAQCILYSAYLKPEVTREALKKYGAYDCVGKSESPKRLVDAVANAATESCAGPADLSIRFPSPWMPKKVVQTLFYEETDIPPVLVEDLIRQLFPHSQGVTLETMEGEVASSVSASQRRSVVLKAYPDDLEPVVVKLAPTKRIQEETRNYREYVKDRLVGRFYAQLERSKEFWDLGGTVYAFLGSSLRTLPCFSSFYKEHQDAQVILRPLEHFFGEVWSKHYDKPQSNRNTPLFALYDQSLRLRERLQRFGNQEETRAFPGLTISLINPVPWVLRHSEDSLIPEACLAVTHGDIHGDNLVVDKEHAWAIDFERTGHGHNLRDFAELEVDIFTRLIAHPLNDLSGLCDLALILAGPDESMTSVQPSALPSSGTEISKALKVIFGLRRLAYEVTHYRDFRQYLWGVLLDALFVATRAPADSPQREPALLLGAVLCERLRHWRHRWPPQDWDFTIAQDEPFSVVERKQADAFLSYNSHDRSAVQTVARYLKKEAGLRVWLDQWDLLPGDSWQEEIEETLDKCAACVVFWGPSGLGPWQHEEMRAALERRVGEQGYRVIPVLLPGCRPIGEMPRFLRRVQYVDLSSGLADQEALQYLVRGIRDAVSRFKGCEPEP
jgi:CheY-like chemotaxis protein